MSRRYAAMLVGLAACSPRQVVFHVDTDAPVRPERDPTAAGGTSTWLFDRLSIELRADGPPWVQLDRRDLGVTQEMFLRGDVSFGIDSVVGHQTAAVRLRLFRGDHSLAGEPAPSAVLETTFVVPQSASSGGIDVHGVLRVEDVGMQVGDDGSVPAAEGLPAGSLVGSWPGALARGCVGSAAADEVCVPGGAFWMGDPVLRGTAAMMGGGNGERLAVISPFFVDLQEVRVSDFRARWPELVENIRSEVNTWDQSTDVTHEVVWCNWTPLPVGPDDPRGSLPLNCVTWAGADAYCRLQGKQLPTEAQYEFLASGLGSEFPFPWGFDEARCGDAIFGRSGLGYYLKYEGSCRTTPGIGGPEVPGRGARDRIRPGANGAASGGVEVLDLAGNVQELAADAWLPEGPSAIAPETGVLRDPIFEDPGSDRHAVRGGDWTSGAALLRAGSRYGQPDDLVSDQIGFRCARPGTQ